MNKDQIEGAGKQVKGSVTEAIGKVTGNTKTQAKGAAEKVAGKAQGAFGKAKNKLGDNI